MNIVRKISLLLLFSISIMSLFAQSRNCGTDQALLRHFNNDTALLQETLLAQEVLLHKNAPKNDKASITTIVPVVVHVIANPDGVGDISKAQIEDGLRIANEDFRRLNPDTVNTRGLFLPYAADFGIEFRLATIDPFGNCTDGIVRTRSHLTAAADDPAKAVSRWDPTKYLNIWIVNSIETTSPTILGIAQFPSVPPDSTYGLMVRYDYFGSIEASSDDGRTLTHELGHALSLNHTFFLFSGCIGTTCSTHGDRICDTPPISNATYGCNPTQNTCSHDSILVGSPYTTDVVDMIENYMSYDNCQNMFTLDQKDRVFSALTTYPKLINLVSAANLTATGTADPYSQPLCAPVAEFTYDQSLICEGDNVLFEDKSSNGAPTAWSWTFTGGTPTTSPISTPSITYNTAGTYSATLDASNATGNNATTKTNIITVSSLTADYSSINYYENFDNTTRFNDDWIVVDPSGLRKWELTTAASYNENQSVRLYNFSGNVFGEVDALISPSINLSAMPIKTLRFKYAYAQKTTSSSDILKVSVSTDCGKTWQLKRFVSSFLLKTTSPTTADFIPANTYTSLWKEMDISLVSVSLATNLRVKFEFLVQGGNNIYIDDVTFGMGVGIEEIEKALNINIYPNPVHNESATVSFSLVASVSNLQISVRDVLGKKITSIINGDSFSPGKYNLSVDEKRSLKAGIYFIEFNIDNKIITKKLIIR